MEHRNPPLVLNRLQRAQLISAVDRMACIKGVGWAVSIARPFGGASLQDLPDRALLAIIEQWGACLPSAVVI